MAAKNLRGAVHHEVSPVSYGALEGRREKGRIHGQPGTVPSSGGGDSLQIDNPAEWVGRCLDMDQPYGSFDGSFQRTFVERVEATHLDAEAGKILRQDGFNAAVNIAADGDDIPLLQEAAKDAVERRHA